jgi:ERCC4-type nuclease
MKRKIPRILIDTREQDGFLFDGYEAQCTSEKLDAGDYTIVGHDMANDDNSIIIERKKNCNELIGNVGTNWERFLREAEQLTKYKTKLIVVTAPCNFEFLYNNQLTRLHPNFVYKQLSYLQINFGISTLFFPTKEVAENYVFRLFIETLRLTEEDYV